MKRLLKLLAPVLLALAVLGVNMQSAGAIQSANTNWINSRVMYGPNSTLFTSGFHVWSPATLEEFMVVPMHSVKPFQSAGLNAGLYLYENSGANYYDRNQVLLPTNPSFAYYDLALIKIGGVNAAAGTQRGWYYCTATNCTSNLGGGSAANCNWCGQTFTIVGANNAQEGWGTITNKAMSGTSFGSVQGAYHKSYNGWDWWGIEVSAGQCGVVSGDSGSPVITGPDLAHSIVLGMLSSVGPVSFSVTNNPCYSGTRLVSPSFVMVAWADIVAAYPGYNLQPITYGG